MVLCSLFAALLSICSWISVPIADIAFTLQTFGVFLTLGLLGGKRGGIAVFIWLLLGAVGAPVFSGFRGGIGSLAGVTGGYLWGFLFAALTYRLLERFGKLPAMITGQLVCYLCGCLWFSRWAGCTIPTAALTCVAPYLLPDGGKLWLAWHLSNRLKRFGI
jgi:biotin transport system substrate-specific component